MLKQLSQSCNKTVYPETGLKNNKESEQYDLESSESENEIKEDRVFENVLEQISVALKIEKFSDLAEQILDDQNQKNRVNEYEK